MNDPQMLFLRNGDCIKLGLISVKVIKERPLIAGKKRYKSDSPCIPACTESFVGGILYLSCSTVVTFYYFMWISDTQPDRLCWVDLYQLLTEVE